MSSLHLPVLPGTQGDSLENSDRNILVNGSKKEYENDISHYAPEQQVAGQNLRPAGLESKDIAQGVLPGIDKNQIVQGSENVSAQFDTVISTPELGSLRDFAQSKRTQETAPAKLDAKLAKPAEEMFEKRPIEEAFSKNTSINANASGVGASFGAHEQIATVKDVKDKHSTEGSTTETDIEPKRHLEEQRVKGQLLTPDRLDLGEGSQTSAPKSMAHGDTLQEKEGREQESPPETQSIQSQQRNPPPETQSVQNNQKSPPPKPQSKSPPPKPQSIQNNQKSPPPKPQSIQNQPRNPPSTLKGIKHSERDSPHPPSSKHGAKEHSPKPKSDKREGKGVLKVEEEASIATPGSSSRSKPGRGGSVKKHILLSESDVESEIEDYTAPELDHANSIVSHKVHYSAATGYSILYQVRMQQAKTSTARLEWYSRGSISKHPRIIPILDSYESKHNQEIKKEGVDLENYDTIPSPRESEIYEEISDLCSEDEVKAVLVGNGVAIDEQGGFQSVHPTPEKKKKKKREKTRSENGSPTPRRRRVKKNKEDIEKTLNAIYARDAERRSKEETLLLNKIQELIDSAQPGDDFDNMDTFDLRKKCKALEAKTEAKYLASIEKVLLQKTKQSNMLFHQCQALLTSVARHKASLDEAKSKIAKLTNRKRTKGSAIDGVRLRAEKAEALLAERENCIQVLRKQVKKLLTAVQQQHKANHKRVNAHKATKLAVEKDKEKLKLLKERDAVQQKTIVSLKEQVDMLTGQLKLQDQRYEEMRTRLSLERKCRVSDAAKWKQKVEKLELVNIKQQMAVSEILMRSPTSVVGSVSPKQLADLGAMPSGKSKRKGKKKALKPPKSSTGNVAKKILQEAGSSITAIAPTNLGVVSETTLPSQGSGICISPAESLKESQPYVPQPHPSTRGPVILPELGKILKW